MSNGMKGLWLLSVISAFFFGYFSSNQFSAELNSSPVEVKLSTPEEKVTNELKLQASTKKVFEKEQVVIESKPSIENTIQDLTELLSGSQYFTDIATIAEAYNLIADMTEDELLQSLYALEGKLNEGENAQLVSIFIGRLASYDPKAAAEFVEANITNFTVKIIAINSALASWAKTEPFVAYEWYMNENNQQSSNAPLKNAGLAGIFIGMTKHDPNQAFEQLIELSSLGKSDVIATTSFAFALNDKEDFGYFLERSMELDEQGIKEGILRRWATEDPQAAIEWSENILDPKEQRHIEKSIFDSWMSSNPEKAANWYISKASTDELSERASKVISRWSYSDPQSAIDWLDKQQGFETQRQIREIVRNASYSDTQFAIDNLERISDIKEKTSVAYSIYLSMSRKNPTKAEAYLANSPYKSDIEAQQQARLAINNEG